MSSDHNTKPTLIMTGSGSDDCQVTSDPSNLDYKTTEEIAQEYGGKENVMHKSVPKGSLEDEDDRCEVEANLKGFVEADFVERAVEAVEGLAKDE